jgi:hypothetical protein
MAAVQRAYSLCPSLEVLVPALVAGGVELAVTVGVMHPGMPVKPMLASITGGVADAVGKMCSGSGSGGEGKGGTGGEEGGGGDNGDGGNVERGGIEAAAGTATATLAIFPSPGTASFLAEFKYGGAALHPNKPRTL